MINCFPELCDIFNIISLFSISFLSTQTPQTYCAAKVGDLEYVIDHVHTKYPNAPFMATGISMGG